VFAHFRPIFIAFLSLSLGIWLAELFRQGKIIYIIIVGSILVIIILLSLLRLCFKNSSFFHYLWRTRKCFLTVFISVIVGFTSFTIAYNKIIQEEVVNVDSSVDYFVMGTVRSAPVEYEDYMSMFIDDPILTTGSTTIDLDGKSIYLKIDTENIDESSDLYITQAGDTIILVANVTNMSVFYEDNVSSFAYKNNCRYIAYADQDNISIIEGTTTGIASAREFIKEKIYASMDARYAGLAYAIFIGDKSGLDYDLQENFQVTGIAHLLAVSGLNVGFIVLLLMCFLKPTRLKPIWKTAIITLILVLYCLLCDLSPSVIRASLMAVFLLLGNSFGKQGDNLNSVSLAGILLLLIDPMYLFDLSFLLSFASVFAIIMLYPQFEALFMKAHLGKFVSATLAISISAQIGTLPLLINTFGYVSVVSLLVNFLTVPFLGYLYMGMFVALILAIILPFTWGLLWLIQWGLWLVDIVTQWFASWTYASVSVNSIIPIVVAILFIAMFCFSRFCVVQGKKQKIILYSVTSAICVLSVVFNYTIVPLLC